MNYLCIPIVSNNETKGLGIFVFKSGEIKEKNIKLLESLIPILSLSFENDEILNKNNQLHTQLNAYSDLEKIILDKTYKSMFYVKDFPLDNENLKEKILNKKELLYKIHNKILEIPVYIQNWNTSTLVEFFLSLEDIFKKSEFILKIKIEQQNEIINIFSNYKNYFFWIVFEFLLNAIIHSEGKIIGIEIQKDNHYLHLILYDDGEGILRKTGEYYPTKGTGILMLKYIATLMNSQFFIEKGPEGFGTSIHYQYLLNKEIVY